MRVLGYAHMACEITKPTDMGVGEVWCLKYTGHEKGWESRAETPEEHWSHD